MNLKIILIALLLLTTFTYSFVPLCQNFATVLEEDETTEEETVQSIPADCLELVCEIANCCGRGVRKLVMLYNITQLPNQYNRRCYPNYESTYVSQIESTWSVNNAQAKIKNLIGLYSQFNSYCRYNGNTIRGSVSNKINLFNTDLNWSAKRTKQRNDIIGLLTTTALKDSFRAFDDRIFNEWMNNLNACSCDQFRTMSYFTIDVLQVIVDGLRSVPQICTCMSTAPSMTSAFFFSMPNSKWLRAYPETLSITSNPSNTAYKESEYYATRNSDGTFYFRNFKNGGNYYMTRLSSNKLGLRLTSSPSTSEKFRLQSTGLKDQFFITTADGRNFLHSSSSDFFFRTGSGTNFKVLFYYQLV